MKAIYATPVVGAVRRGRWAQRRLSEVMTRPVLSVAGGVSVDRAVAAILTAGVRHLAVVDDAGRCVGVLSARDVARAWAAHQDMSAVTVGEVFDDKPAMLGHHALVLDAARVMRASAVDAVVVVDAGGQPVGIFTSSDLVRLLSD